MDIKKKNGRQDPIPLAVYYSATTIKYHGQGGVS